MAQAIYWILAIAVMLVLLISAIYELINRIKSDKIFKEVNKKTTKVDRQTN